ncbi:SLOG family protein [Actinoplanes sp. NPDC020271]|uniref:SLOG family protein n=1 Tax=Actinoplanes sp. NPDC020271 TaxID=3363896 RepID=UPI00378A0991
MSDPRVLVCGSRRWPWPATVHAVLNRLATRYGEHLVVIEGAASGADRAAHQWCLDRSLGARHRCHPVDWDAIRRSRPDDWRRAGPERNTRMLLGERPQLIVAFHNAFDPARGGTSDMCLKGVLCAVPVWLVPGADLRAGRWLSAKTFPRGRVGRVDRELGNGPPLSDYSPQ